MYDELSRVISAGKALQVDHHLLRQRQIVRVEWFDLIDQFASVIGEIEWIDQQVSCSITLLIVRRLALSCHRLRFRDLLLGHQL